MKTRLIVGTVLVACMVVLTLVSGLAQAQSLSSPTMVIEEGEGAAEELTNNGTTPQFVDQNRFFTGACTIGPRAGQRILLIRQHHGPPLPGIPGQGGCAPSPYLIEIPCIA